MNLNQEIAFKIEEIQLPQTWDEIAKQSEKLRTMGFAPLRFMPTYSIADLIQTAAA